MTKGMDRAREMSDNVVEFFEELGRRGPEPLLAKVTGGCASTW
jgi:hypothetical protein